jgi:hypothetical protein
MPNVTIDTLKLARNLQRHEFSQAQAEGLAEELRSSFEEGIATKSDIESSRKDTKGDIESLRKDTKADIESLRKDLGLVREETRAQFALVREEMRGLEDRISLRMIKWMVGIGFVLLEALGGATFFLARLIQTVR